jgi:peptidoglycan/LPS O-acetylase OafA/YrhL
VIGYVANWVAVAGQSIGMLGHTWSLAVEEQFYILWPALLLAGLRLGRSRLVLIVLLLVFLDTPYRLLLDLNGGFMHVFVGTDTRGDALLLGCVLALLETRWHPARRLGRPRSGLASWRPSGPGTRASARRSCSSRRRRS